MRKSHWGWTNSKTGYATLSRRQIVESRRLNRLMVDLDYDPELIAHSLGYGFLRSKRISADVFGVLVHNVIVVRGGLSRVQELLTIAHEHCHKAFHPEYTKDVVCRRRSSMQSIKEETQSDLFAVLAWVPKMPAYCSSDADFFLTTGLSEDMGMLRINYYLRTGN